MPPKVKVLASGPEKLKLYRNLADTKRLVPSFVPPDRRGYGAGLFAVGKDAARDRLILDARPANLLEQANARWSKTLASAVAVTGLVLPRDRTMLFAGADLRDCFYCGFSRSLCMQRRLKSYLVWAWSLTTSCASTRFSPLRCRRCVLGVFAAPAPIA